MKWCQFNCFYPSDPTKFFGCELGAQTQFDAKNDRYIVNGSHEANKLQDMLDGFIRKFVLCSECDNPETELVSEIVWWISTQKGIHVHFGEYLRFLGQVQGLLIYAEVQYIWLCPKTPTQVLLLTKYFKVDAFENTCTLDFFVCSYNLQHKMSETH